MNKLYDIVRLVMTSTLSDRDIASSLHVAKNTVRRYRNLTAACGQHWEALAAMEPQALERTFNRRLRTLTQKRQPDFAHVHEECQRHGVTLLLLWEEYRADNPDDALSYSQFTHHYRQFERGIKLSMRQRHLPGERVFVDFSGKRPHYIDPGTGQAIAVELFVGATGYAHYIYALALPSQTLRDWLHAHVGLFDYLGGVPQIIVPDNLRAAVTCAGRDAVINRSYADLARHYGTTILPARPYHPRDKGKVEVAVQIAQRWILARLRHQRCFSLAELNAVIAELLTALNDRPFKRLPGCRRERFELERASLQPLPATRYEYAEWQASQRVGPDYHLHVRGHWYSVPYHLVGQTLDVRVTATAVELFHAHRRVACHPLGQETGGHTTDTNHQPPAHRAYGERTQEYYLDWAAHIGPNLQAIVRQQFARSLPALGLPACDALRRLARQHGEACLEAAARRAVEIKSLTVKSVKSLLATGRYRAAQAPDSAPVSPTHDNLRGPSYFTEPGDTPC